MSELTKFNKLVKYIKTGVLFILFSFLAFIITSENALYYIVLTGLPIIHIEKLLVIHLFSNTVLFLSTLILGINFIRLYIHLKVRQIPFAGFIWMFGCFNLFISGIFLMNMMNLWRSYVWIDASIRMISAIFAAAAVITFTKSLSTIKTIKTPEEYEALKEEIEKVRKIGEEIIKIRTPKHK